MDIENYLKQDDRLMLVTGACEQHGYLSLLTDSKIPMAFAAAASQQTGVLVGPPLNFGISPYFARYPGTISLGTQTYLAVVADIVRSLHAQGFKRLLFVNSSAQLYPDIQHVQQVTLLHEGGITGQAAPDGRRHASNLFKLGLADFALLNQAA